MIPLSWADDLPAGWRAMPLRAVANYMVSNVDKIPSENEVPVRLCNYTDVYNQEFITPDLDLMHTTATESEVAKFGLKVDDVVITKDSESWDDIGVPALVKETAEDLVCGYHLAIVRPRANVLDGGFLLRCLQSKPIRIQLELAANGVTRFGIPKAAIGSLTLPIPPLAHQCAIADYLERETARLDALVAAKERMLQLLPEKLRAIVTCAVTRGIDQTARLRESGVSWLGKIPEHWELKRLRYCCKSIQTGSTPSGDFADYLEADQMVEWFTPVDFDGTELRESRRKASFEAVRQGDIPMFLDGTVFVVGIGATLGKVAISRVAASANQQINAVIPRADTDGDFLAYALWRLNEVMNAMANRATLPILNQQRLGDIYIALPSSIIEQKAITAYIQEGIAKLDALRRATKQSINLLEERRAALIAAAVTGRLQVPALPDPIPSEEEMECSSTT